MAEDPEDGRVDVDEVAGETVITATEKALFPAKRVELLSGEHVVMKPWGMATGRLLTPVVAGIFQLLQDGISSMANDKVVDIKDLVVRAEAEVEQVVRETLGWDQEEMDKQCAFEDLFTLAQGVLDVCVFREDGGGAMGKMMALVNGATEQVGEAQRGEKQSGRNKSKPQRKQQKT